MIAWLSRRGGLLPGGLALAACAASLGFGVGIGGCGGSSPAVPQYPHPEGAPSEAVGFMPPPAPIEQLDAEPPARGCLWADGQWVWKAQSWDWRPGGWVRPPAGCRYSAPTVQWGPGGTSGILYYRPGRWYSVSEPKICPDPVNCPAPSPSRSNTEASRGS